jgi:hypothetical protein
LFGITTVSLGEADVDATVMLDSGVTVSGRVAFDEGTLKPPADLTRIRVSLTPVRGKTPTLGVPQATVDATGEFKFSGVARRYRCRQPAWAGRSGVPRRTDATRTIPSDRA